MAAQWLGRNAKIVSRLAGSDMEHSIPDAWGSRSSDRNRASSESADEIALVPRKSTLRKPRPDVEESRIELPKQPPPIPPAFAIPSRVPNAHKANSSPFSQSHVTTSRPGPSTRKAPDMTQRRAHETLPAVSAKSFYPGTDLSKHFPEKDARNPNTFLPPPDPRPESSPPRPIAAPVNRPPPARKNRHPAAEPIDLVSEEDEEETPEREEPRKTQMPVASGSRIVDHASAAPPSQRPNNLTARNLAQHEMPSGQETAKRKRGVSKSSSVDPQDDGRDDIEDFDDAAESETIRVMPSPSRSIVGTKKARMQDKNGNSSALVRPAEGPPAGLIGYVNRCEVDGKGFHAQSAKLIKRGDGIAYSELLFKWNDIINLFIPNMTPEQQKGPYHVGIVYQAVTTGSRIVCHCFEMDGQALSSKDRASVIKVLSDVHKTRIGTTEEHVKRVASNQIFNIAKAEAERWRSTQENPVSKGPAQQLLQFKKAKDEPSGHYIQPQGRPQPKSPAQRTASASSGGIRRSSRTTVAEERAERELALRAMPPKPRNPDKVMCRWPPTGRMELEITRGDYYRLHDDEFLNDTLIDFGLRYIVEKRLSPKPNEVPSDSNGTLNLGRLCADDVFVFNPFFYNRLSIKTRGLGRVAEGLPREAYPDWPAYDSVKKWTNKVDIFSKKFIIVPVNENLHWYMAVIYNPGVLLDDARFLRGNTPLAEDGSVRPLTRSVGKDEDAQDLASVQKMMSQEEVATSAEARSLSRSPEIRSPSEIDNVPSSYSQPPLPIDDTIVVQRQAAQMHQPLASVESQLSSRSAAPSSVVSAVAMEIEPLESALSPAAHTRGQDPLAPIEIDDTDHTESHRRGLIMTFDSLGSSHGAVGVTLNRWLVYEAREKKKVELSWKVRAQKPLPYKSVSVPPQQNFSDCGIYCLHFMEVLLDDPEGMMGFIFKTMLKKDQLNGAVIEDYRTRWQGENALEGREKWRKIIQELSDPLSSPEETNQSALPFGAVAGSQDSTIEIWPTDHDKACVQKETSVPVEAPVYKERTASDPSSFLQPVRVLPRPPVQQPPSSLIVNDRSATGQNNAAALRPSGYRDRVEVTHETEDLDSALTLVSTTSFTGATAATTDSIASTSHLNSGIEGVRITSDGMPSEMEVDPDPNLDKEVEAMSVDTTSALPTVDDNRIVRLPEQMLEDEESEKGEPKSAEQEDDDSQEVVVLPTPTTVDIERMRMQAESLQSSRKGNHLLNHGQKTISSYSHRDLRHGAPSEVMVDSSGVATDVSPVRTETLRTPTIISLSEQPTSYTAHVTKTRRSSALDISDLMNPSSPTDSVHPSKKPAANQQQHDTNLTRSTSAMQPNTATTPDRNKHKRRGKKAVKKGDRLSPVDLGFEIIEQDDKPTAEHDSRG